MRLNRLLIGLAVTAWVSSLFAVEWNKTTGGNLDDAANWNATPKGTDYLYVKAGQSAPFTLSTANANFFGGAMLRYSAAITVTNDFGAGFALTNLGAAADSAFHIENNAKVVHKSGTIIAFKGKAHDGAYLTGKAKLILDGPDAVFEQRTGAFNLRSNSASGKDEEWVIVTNGASLTVKNSSLRIGSNAKASEGHVVVTGSGSTLTANATYIGYNVCNAGVTSVVEVVHGGHFKSPTLELGSTRTGDRLFVTGAGSLCEVPDTFYARRAADVRVSDQATLTAKDLRVGASATDRTRLTVTSDAVVYATRTVGLDNASMVVDGARLCVTNNSKLGVGGGSSLCLVNGGVLAGTNGEVKVMGGACLAVTNATVAVDAASISVEGSGSSVLLKDATLTMTNALFNADSQTTFFAKDSSVAIRQSGNTYCPWQGCLGFDNCTLVYPRVKLNVAGAELAFTNTVAHGGRIEMTKSSTVRIHNSQVYLDEPNGTCIFMMGAGDDGDNYERHVYVSGSNTYVQATKGTSMYSGIFVRGSNTTLHVSIPAEGLSKDHPLFEFKTLSFQTEQQRLRVEIDADGQLGLNGGGTYTLFKGTGASTIKVNYIYNPNDIAVTKQDFDGYSEVYVRVRSKRGMVLLIR